MHLYIAHLLEDIFKAHKREGFHSKQKHPESFEEEMQDIEDHILGKDKGLLQPFTYYCDLKTESFPPVEQLSESEMEQVALAFIKMAQSWNLLISVPDRYPAQKKYELIVNFLEKRVSIPADGAFWGFDNCTGNPEGCFFAEYCSCLKYWKDSEQSQ